ncbi:pseudouridine-5'-phosphatase-like isoform X1 [Diorhabda carinulata]|uniref:pseudouridine-5'-phosphatase-like isoform X2 n=1 Tax=Diorhabda sublineata TaxID=1163346 RepID=UPI0024E11924|nr:pseudouridine-5'-phosphatase-like isoform X2 [Diorhabda sublineata]XP_057661277.1 pseudouridine-5'-phosphatase-like isoform X1 [Diorhabda carinulata]
MSACRPLKRVTHVIFDMDGVLLDTEILYTKATQNILDKYEKTFTWEVKTQMMGLHGSEMAKRIVDVYELPLTPEEYYSQAMEQYKIIMPQCQLMPGAFKLVKHLHSNNIPIAVATSSSQESFDLKTQNHKDFFSLFSHIVCGGSDPDVKAGKPAPDIFLTCAKRFSDPPHPEKCLVFEDAPNGILAALAAGMQAVMIPDANVAPELRKNAHVVIDRLDNAPLELFGLPSIKGC